MRVCVLLEVCDVYNLYLFQCFSTALALDYGATYLIPGGREVEGAGEHPSNAAIIDGSALIGPGENSSALFSLISQQM